MRTPLVRSIMLMLVMLVICGVAYPVAGWALSQAAFRSQADGSISANGSALIGQPWSPTTSAIDPSWFQGRPDADDPLELNGVPGESGAASLGPTSPTLVTAVQGLLKEWHAVGVDPTEDLVTTSGSGLDPDIAPMDAIVQIPMILRARPGLTATSLRTLIARETHPAQLGFLGEPYIVVLELNEGLASLSAASR
jgi:potassium-transporting ATPase KdpC subunit